MNSNTRFRAYQLDKSGSSMSYYDGSKFTLIETTLDPKNWPTLCDELNICKGKRVIDTLHITSWDDDHCSEKDLQIILSEFKPTIIEYPKYSPHTENSKNCLSIISKYGFLNPTSTIKKLDYSYISSLNPATAWESNNIIYNQGEYEFSNDNSSIKFFRSGKFNVLSLGDVDSPYIAKYLMQDDILCKEVDILILAHHGAEDGINTDEFIKAIKPTIAICTSDYGNEYEHPKQSVRNILQNNNVPLYTTKTGDVIIESTTRRHPYSVLTKTPVFFEAFNVKNLQSNSTGVSSSYSFFVKRKSFL